MAPYEGQFIGHRIYIYIYIWVSSKITLMILHQIFQDKKKKSIEIYG